MTDKIRNLLKDVQTVYEGKGMTVHPNSFDRLRMEVIKLDNINKQQTEQIEEMKCCGNCENRYEQKEGVTMAKTTKTIGIPVEEVGTRLKKLSEELEKHGMALGCNTEYKVQVSSKEKDTVYATTLTVYFINDK